MNKLRDSTPTMSRPNATSKIMIRYPKREKENGISLCMTEIFPNERITIDWYGI
ncbi:MAG: hypothetical protein HUK16_05230 [Bacteroidales bacterium]|nr:hypothetical protein [Bacteroidales bacterium]